MRKLFILLILLLTACSSNETTTIKKPSYLTVFNEFKETQMFESCKDYQNTIHRTPHEQNRAMPSSTNMDMEIISDSHIGGVYTANLSCKVRVTYSLSASTFINEEYEKSLGELSFSY